ncbi:hypothetical protein T09_2669 [Trichinella sp. T9]|nr:hypothetical protein T09_2669 [Trichinella sp. T9]
MVASSLMLEPVAITICSAHTFEHPQHFLRLPVYFNLYTLPSYTRDIPLQQFVTRGSSSTHHDGQLATWSTRCVVNSPGVDTSNL